MSEPLPPVLETRPRRFRPYPKYKDSGVEWLGKIPAHWHMTKMWDVAVATSGGTPAKENLRYWDGGIPWVSPKDMKRRFIEYSEDTVSAAAVSESGLKLVANPAVLVVVRGMILAHSFPVAITKVPVTINQDMKALQLRAAVDAEFFAYWLGGVGRDLVAVLVDEAAHGTKAIRMDRWRVTPVEIPPLDEQRAIVAFLDRETAKIDALLAKKQRLIELLQEKRLALITQAVTKGLDPRLPMKDSGVEWLGEIPAHWEVKPIRALARQGYRTFTDGDWIESPFIRDEGIRLIQTGNVGVGGYKEQGFRYIDEDTFRAFGCTEILPGDVLICRLADPVGRACVAPDLGCRMITSVDVCVLKPAKDVNAVFVVYALSSSEYLSWLGGICRGGTRDRVSRSMLGAIRVQKPPLAEQGIIAAFLDHETGRIDRLVATVRAATDRLNELRTALILTVVTGKIDVREEAA